MTTTKPPKKTRAQLQRQVLELTGQLVSSYHFAADALSKAGTDKLMGSGVLLQLTVLGGREIVSPVVIRDGLSAATIDAIRGDLARSYEQAVEFKLLQPKGK